MKSNTALDQLLHACSADALISLRNTTAGWNEYLAKLDDLIALVGPQNINTPIALNTTALGLLASRRSEPIELIEMAVKRLLNAGANPLAGYHPIICPAGFVNENIVSSAMFDALVKAEQQGKPFLDDMGGNVFHVLARDGLGWFSGFSEKPRGPVSVISKWLSEQRASDGQSPLHIAWRFQFARWREMPIQMGLPESLWMISTSKPDWHPDLELSDRDGVRVVDIVHQSVMDGIPMGDKATKVWPLIEAIIEHGSLETMTPRVAPSSSRPVRL